MFNSIIKTFNSIIKYIRYKKIYKSLIIENERKNVQKCEKLINDALNIVNTSGDLNDIDSIFFDKNIEKYLLSFCFVYSCRHGFINIVEKIINMGYNINEYNKLLNENGYMSACINNRVNILEILIKNNVNIYDKSIPNGLLFASDKGNYEIVKLILERIKKDNNEEHKNYIISVLNISFIFSCKHGYIDIINLLIYYNLKINLNTQITKSRNRKILSGFIYACKYGHSELVKMLINRNISNSNKDIGFYYCYTNLRINSDNMEYLETLKIFLSSDYEIDNSYMSDKNFKTICDNFICSKEYYDIKNSIYYMDSSDIYCLINLLDTNYMEII